MVSKVSAAEHFTRHQIRSRTPPPVQLTPWSCPEASKWQLNKLIKREAVSLSAKLITRTSLRLDRGFAIQLSVIESSVMKKKSEDYITLPFTHSQTGPAKVGTRISYWCQQQTKRVKEKWQLQQSAGFTINHPFTHTHHYRFIVVQMMHLNSFSDEINRLQPQGEHFLELWWRVTALRHVRPIQTAIKPG